ncbi:hypothetical protein RND71_012499 [Anisodus tanguticus]|uniref:Mitochondrial outer membrane protein porin 2-like n=1 Tax=Anisodus tanguticus TaxID=243964 RepID=A0AAE1VH06_9SOLA|nr:hypothetical protein RND71_012499 [Anisodus tanguticus]
MSKKGPGLFSDFGKNAKDILTKDYSHNQKFTIASRADAGIDLTSTLVRKGGLSSGGVAAKYKYKKTILGVRFNTQSNISTTLTISDVLPSTKAIASWKLLDYSSSKIEVQYFYEHACFTTAVGSLSKSPALDISAAIGTPHVAFGTEASYSLASGNFTKYNAGVSLKKPNFSASVILTDKGDAVRASFLHHLGQQKRGTAVGEIARKFSTNENTSTVGCSYSVNPQTVVKAKLNNHGNLGALVQHKLKSKSFLTLCGNFDTMEKIPKFGVMLSLMP